MRVPTRSVLVAVLLMIQTASADPLGEDARLRAAMRGRVWHDRAPLRDGSLRMTCVMEYLNAEGTVTKTLQLDHRRSFRDGQMRDELLSASEDGRDVLERERRSAEAAPASGFPKRWSLDESLSPPVPFLDDLTGSYRIQTLSDGVADGRLRYATGPRSDDYRTAEGVLELDPADGLPRRHTFTPRPLPKMIRALITTVHYGRLDGLAMPQSSESVGEGGFLFIKRRFRVRMTYYDWDLAPAARDAGQR
jgi:hypothetical protein